MFAGKKHHFTSNFLILLSISALILLAACKDDPLDPHKDHFEAEGIVFYQSGIKVAEIFRGVTQDTLLATAGQRTTHFEVKFFNPNRQEIDPPGDEHHSFAWEIQDTSIVGVWQHPGEEGSFEFHLDGKKQGTTQMEFFIMHEGHPDFRSGKIPVRVNP